MATPQEVFDATVGAYCLQRMGLESNLEVSRRNRQFSPPPHPWGAQVEVKEYARAAKHLRARQYYGFDPRRDGPPDGVPELCPRCGNANAIGLDKCRWCASEVVGLTRFRLLSNALIHAYYPDRCGLKLGGVGYKVQRQAVPAAVLP